MKLKNITFKQFIETYNFREAIPSRYADSPCRHSTKVIRIDFRELVDGYDGCWFEFGVYDWGDSKYRLINQVLDDRILNSYISSISYSDDDEILIVDLTKDKYTEVHEKEERDYITVSN